MTRTGMLLVGLMSLLLPMTSLAQVSEAEAGFRSGLLHPLLGLDHLLAMLAVGILSAQLGGRSLWTVPLAFLVFMGLGAWWGLLNLPLLAVQLGITLSVISLGAAVFFAQAMPVSFAMAMVGVFAVFHGHAHGSEMPSPLDPISYVFGFICGTGLIHCTGLTLGHLGQTRARELQLNRAMGGMVMVMGGLLLFA